MGIFKHLLSTRVSLVLLLTFAISMAVATFIENDHGTPVARALVYEAWWFELTMLWLAVNFLAHISKYKLFHKNRWPVGLFHIAFVLIILGAGVTRYFSTEGTIHIREGQKVGVFYSSDRFLQFKKLGDKAHDSYFEVGLKLIPYKFQPRTVIAVLNDQEFQVRIEEYVKGAKEEIVPGKQTLVELVVTEGQGRDDHILPMGGSVSLGNFILGTGKGSKTAIKIFKEGDEWMIISKVHLQTMEMASQQIGVVHAGEVQALKLRSLYQWAGGAFLVKEIRENAALRYTEEKDEKAAKNLPEVAKLKVLSPDNKPITEAYVRISNLGSGWHRFNYQNEQYAITYGPRPQMLPFSLQLRDFQLTRYPGSQSPESYASELTVIDTHTSFPYRVFMNNVLDYKGYRFYQSSYDTDEKGTVLAINQDRPGTYITYLGYLLLTLGMVLTFFARGSRFSILNKNLVSLKQRASTTALTLLLLFSSLYSGAQQPKILPVPEEKANEYGKLIVQDLDGRMKPLNTLANEILRKLNGKSRIKLKSGQEDLELNAEQFLLAVQLEPITFSQLPVIRIDEQKSKRVFDALKIKVADRVSFRSFINSNGDYLLHNLVEEANKLKPAERNEAHKELLKVDERFNIFYALLTGDFLRIFPNKEDPNNTWFTSQQSQKGFSEEDARFVENISNLYLEGLHKGLQSNNWKQADDALAYMHLFQQKAGEKVYPSENLIKGELFYNKLNLGNKLFGIFWLTGVVMLVLAIVQLFKPSKAIRLWWNAGRALAWIGFVTFTFHLALRWYIAKHPPWSDGFEMLVFVAWGILLFGLLFASKSRFTIPLALLFSGTLLFVSFLDWLNPEITNLMPVLHSYWLKIHVAVIVSSYAPLALSAILALMTLLLICFKPASPDAYWWRTVNELIIVNEMAITVGLFLLTVGTFLGGVWANESWGRYWAWDPKETWALISVIIYAFVLHLRLIPSLNNALVFNLASMWAFSSIVMTSFGVNYYLSGLHSYAAGDPVPVPLWVYWIVVTLAIVSLASAFRYRRMENKTGF